MAPDWSAACRAISRPARPPHRSARLDDRDLVRRVRIDGPEVVGLAQRPALAAEAAPEQPVQPPHELVPAVGRQLARGRAKYPPPGRILGVAGRGVEDRGDASLGQHLHRVIERHSLAVVVRLDAADREHVAIVPEATPVTRPSGRWTSGVFSPPNRASFSQGSLPLVPAVTASTRLASEASVYSSSRLLAAA
jgi:hypothetical protein